MDFGRYIAHRGLHSESVPENSLGAFRLAAEKGIPVELDVRLTKDMKLAVIHDNDLKRLCGVNRKVSELSYEELSAYSLTGSTEHIPLLKDVLRLVDGRIPLLIEIKRGGPFWETEKRLYKLLGSYKGSYAVQSFSPISLLWFRLFAKEVSRGQLITESGEGTRFERITQKLCTKPWVWKLISRPEFVSCDLRSISLEKVFAILDSGAEVYTWTANTSELIETAKAFSKTIIAENFPEGHDF